MSSETASYFAAGQSRRDDLLVVGGTAMIPNGVGRTNGACVKGRIVALGYDADLTLVDLAAPRTIRNVWTARRSEWTPYDGMAITGRPFHTLIRDQVAVLDEQLVGAPLGKATHFLDAHLRPSSTAV
ncbi:MAG: hypothetical protein FJ167_11995 [Gammaproteobacteria bacterium]|nr:hypothetical protein [Gammaproteobacteria bacterium]